MRILDKTKENKLFFITFGVTLINSIYFLLGTNFNNLIKGFYPPLYVVNYDCGYSPRLLIGSIFSLFFKDKLSYETILFVLLVIYFIICLVFSLIVNKYLKNTDYKHLKLFIVFLAATPFFNGILDFFGVVDMFWTFAIFFSLWAVDKKGLRWLVPIACVAGIAIHEYFAVTYMVPCAIMIYHQFAKKPNVSNFVYVVFSAVLLSAASCYFLFFASDTMKMTFDEMMEFIENRLDTGERPLDEAYLEIIFFWKAPAKTAELKTIMYFKYIEYVFGNYIFTDTGTVMSKCLFSLCVCVIFSPLAFIFIKSFKEEKTPIKKITYLLSLTPVLLGVGYQFFSTDDTRFMYHFIIMIVFLLLFMVKEKEEVFIESYTKLTNRINNPLIIVASILIAKLVFSGVVA